jgi:sulfur carrier protein
MPVKLILRDKEYEVKPGMTLLSALQKNNILPESVIATREGEMILEDEILKDGDVIKLIAVISGGSCHCEGDSPKQSPTLRGGCFVVAPLAPLLAMTSMCHEMS